MSNLKQNQIGLLRLKGCLLIHVYNDCYVIVSTQIARLGFSGGGN